MIQYVGHIWQVFLDAEYLFNRPLPSVSIHPSVRPTNPLRTYLSSSYLEHVSRRQFFCNRYYKCKEGSG